MPYTMNKIDGYRVSSPHGTKAKSTSRLKAKRQIRLLRAVEHGWRPSGSKVRPKENVYSKALSK